MVNRKKETMIKFLETNGAWNDVLNACRTTVNKDEITKEPESIWKRRLLLSEHSPIRKLKFNWKWLNLKYWVSTHFVRHKYGVEHWIGTQRADRTCEDRDIKPQGAEVTHEAEANAQAIINISRKRLCTGASPETRQAWQLVVDEIRKVDAELASCCVPDCVYRGYCYEFVSCGYHKTKAYQEALKHYRAGINE